MRMRRVVRVLPSPSPHPLPRGEGEPLGRAEIKLESLECSQHVLSCSLSPRERARVRGNSAIFGRPGRQLELSARAQCLLVKIRQLVMLSSMNPNHSSQPAQVSSAISRREFLAASSAALLAGTVTPAKSSAADSSTLSELALNGGEKAVKQSAKLPIRWGEPERERLNTMLGQDSLFYWKGPQTTLLIERSS